GGRRAIEQAADRRHEVVGDGAAQAAIGQLDDAVLRTGFDAAALQDFAIDADVAEFVDDHREPATAGVLQDMPHQGGLTGTQEARDDGAGNLGQRTHETSSWFIGGTRAITPLRNDSGRARHGTMPLSEAAKLRAAATISSACTSGSMSPIR